MPRRRTTIGSRAALATVAVISVVGIVALVAWWTLRRDATPATVEPPSVARADDADPANPGRVRVRDGSPELSAPVVSPTAREVRISCAVVDSAGLPVGGARVTVTSDRAADRSTHADAAGRFEVVAGTFAQTGRLRGALAATDDRGNAGTRTFDVPATSTETVDIGLLKIVPAHDVVVHVTHGGSPVAGALVSIVRVSENGHDVPTRFTQRKTAADGNVTLQHVPDGRVEAYGYARQLGRAMRSLEVPAETSDGVELVLAGRDVSVLVVEIGTGTPIPGARLTLRRVARTMGGTQIESFEFPPVEVAQTDENGRTTILSVGAADVLDVQIRAAGYASPGGRFAARLGRGRTRVPAEATEARFELERQTSLRFPVVDGEVPVPENGTAIRLRQDVGSGVAVGSATAEMTDGELVVTGVSPGVFSAIAETPDGAVARLWGKTEEGVGQETSFRKPRWITVRVTEDGRPLAGGLILALNPGNNAYGPPTALDGDGVAVLGPFHGGQVVTLTLTTDAKARSGGRLLGIVDVDAGDGSLGVDLPGVRQILIDITVDGRRTLPAGLFGGPTAGELVERESVPPATLRLRVRPSSIGAPIPLRVGATGFLQQTTTIAGDASSVTGRASIDLRSGGGVRARVIPPPDMRMQIRLELWNEQYSMWSPAGYSGAHMGGGPDADGVLAIDALEPGRYRVGDGLSGGVTEEVELAAGQFCDLGVLDLSKSGYVTGRVEGPDGAPPEGTRVTVTAEGTTPTAPIGLSGPGRAVSPDGTFQVRVPGDRPVTLRPWHATYMPAADGGEAVLTEPRDGVVLQIVQGATAALPLSDPPPPGSLGSNVRVLFFRGEVKGEPIHTVSAKPSAENVVTLGGYKPGGYTLWVDCRGYVPVTLSGVSLGPGETKLPRVELTRGATLRVRLLVAEGSVGPNATVLVQSQEHPAYARGVNTSGPTEMVITGLGPGVFTLRGYLAQGRAGALPLEIESDGAYEIVIEWDVR